MKKIVAILALAFVFATGMAAAADVHTDQAMACQNPNSKESYRGAHRADSAFTGYPSTTARALATVAGSSAAPPGLRRGSRDHLELHDQSRQTWGARSREQRWQERVCC
jgi:hypothetical protein